MVDLDTRNASPALNFASSSMRNQTGYPRYPPLAGSGKRLRVCCSSRVSPNSLRATALSSSGLTMVTPTQQPRQLVVVAVVVVFVVVGESSRVISSRLRSISTTVYRAKSKFALGLCWVCSSFVWIRVGIALPVFFQLLWNS